MKTLKKLLGNEERVWLDVSPRDFVSFLTFAKNNDCKWMNGDDIKPKLDLRKHKHALFMGISNDRNLGFVSGMCWSLGKDIKKFNYKDIKENLWKK